MGSINATQFVRLFVPVEVFTDGPSGAQLGASVDIVGYFLYNAQWRADRQPGEANLPTTRRAPLQAPLFRLNIVTITLRLKYWLVYARSRSSP
jgi:hypothetical protein